MHEHHAVLGEPDGSILFGKTNQIPKVGGFRVVNYAHVSLPLGVLPVMAPRLDARGPFSVQVCMVTTQADAEPTLPSQKISTNYLKIGLPKQVRGGSN
jgi:hypothetical protein